MTRSAPRPVARSLFALVLLAATAAPAAATAAPAAATAAPAAATAAPAAATAATATPAAAPAPTAAVAPAAPTVTTDDPGPTATATASTPPAATDDHIRRRTTLSLTPDEPGVVDVRVTYEVPDRVSSLETTIPEGATVTETEGFSRTGDGALSWDGRDATPAFTFAYEVNFSVGITTAAASPAAPDARAGDLPGRLPAPSSTTGRHAAVAAAPASTSDAVYTFVDTGPWAITRVPSLATRWEYRGETVDLSSSVAVAGEGATGGELAYLGPVSTYERRAGSQTFTLAVPAAAEPDLAAPPAEILDSLAAASTAFDVGARDPSVFVVAAPMTVRWGPAGIEYGGSDTWVQADSRLDTPRNIWLHEYVHTRLAFEPATETRWLTEGVPEYYASLLTLEQGRIDFDAFRSHLERGTHFPETALADPASWTGQADYFKGGLVYGDLDRRVRVAAGDATGEAVLSRLNRASDPVSQRDLLAAVEAAGGDDPRAAARRFTETAATPTPWNVTAHASAFSDTPAVRYLPADGVARVTGPHRNRTVSPNETLVTGETLTVSVPVANLGDAPGGYEVTLLRDDTAVANATGTIAADASATAAVTVPLAAAGTYRLEAGAESVPYTVRDPAPVAVTDLAANATDVAPGDSVWVRAAVAGARDRPAAGDLALSVDGDPVSARRVALDAGDTTTLAFRVRLTDPGTHELAVGERTVRVTVTAPATETESTTTRTTGALSWPALATALAVAAWLLARRQSGP